MMSSISEQFVTFGVMEKHTFNKKLAKQIKVVRESKGLSQGQLAKLCGGKPKQAIQRVEAGLVMPSAYFVFQIARSLKVPVAELMEV